MIPGNSDFLSYVSRAEQPVSSLIDEPQEKIEVTEKVNEAAQGILTHTQPASFSSPLLRPANAGPLKENFGEGSPTQLPKPLVLEAPVSAPPKKAVEEVFDMFSLSSPPRTKKASATQYLSPITPSRVSSIVKGKKNRSCPPNPPSNKHYVETLVTASKEALAGLKGRDKFTVIDSPDRTSQDLLRDRNVSLYIQGCREAIGQDGGGNMPALKCDRAQITVPKVNTVLLKRGNEKLVFQIHGEPGSEALFPVEGDRTMTLSEKSGVSPAEAVKIIREGKRRKLNGESIKLSQHFKESLAKLTSQVPSSSSSSSSST